MFLHEIPGKNPCSRKRVSTRRAIEFRRRRDAADSRHAAARRSHRADTAVPEKVLKMPPCDPKDPSAIPREALPYLKLPPETESVSVELTYRDGSVSEIKSFRR